MAYDKRADCANSGTGITVHTGDLPGAQVKVTCTRCKQETYATVGLRGSGMATLWVHLRPGKTLADRR